MIAVDHVAADGDRAAGIVAFLGAHPAATAYAMPPWLLAVARSTGGEAGYDVARRDGHVAGVLPVVTSPRGPIAALLPARFRPVRRVVTGWGLHGGPLLAPGLDARDAARVFDALLRSLVRPPARRATISLPVIADRGALFDRVEAVHGFRSTGVRRALVKPLAGLTPATLAETYGEDLRAALAEARHRGVEVGRATGPGDLLELCDMLDEAGPGTVAGPAEGSAQAFVVDAGRAILAAGAGDLWLGRLDGIPVAAAFVLHAARTSCLWLGAASRDQKVLPMRPLEAVVHHAMADALACGHERFELGEEEGGEGFPGAERAWRARAYEERAYAWSRGDLVDTGARVAGRILTRVLGRRR